ncbi:hypothetical protein CEUSTIGMA_g7537.t1 [Chlamydomonas eustigma]|uniref:Uncharacterized protein n=1 Tax=Chlamydomonas eustigma TaxID=1157962 RepID=A0A250XB33_9CHLO|nr:hypothetical protein CEUSTIGMA_g7537.t1 [Chlamydomonas eustigma]|eukprot:GAX80099.1 hypothetical protein CEUSTIGMA_g7537.t1 [Chlamydomonas eustigma]
MTCMKSSELASVQKECIWSLSNLAVGSSKLVQKMADLRVFEDVIGVLHQSNGDEGIIRESAYVLANPWSTPMGTDATKALMDQGVVKEMIELLALDTPEKVLKVVMDGLKDAVKKGMVLQITAKEGAVNPVVSLMRQMDAHGRLEGLSSASSDVGVRSMANTLLNALTLDE